MFAQFCFILLAAGIAAVFVFFLRSQSVSETMSRVFPERFPGQLLFQDKRASGRSLKTIRTAFSGASRCPQVLVFKDEIWLFVAFPYSLLFSGIEWDLLHRIPVSSIRSVKRLNSVKWRGVEIEFL